MALGDLNNSPSFHLISVEASVGNESTNPKTTCPCTECGFLDGVTCSSVKCLVIPLF